MRDRQQHLDEVRATLQRQLAGGDWEFSLPNGSGNETYFASGKGRTYFIKLGVQIERYQAAAAMGLTPEVLECGYLTDGTTFIVQPYIEGRRPTRSDYRVCLEQIAATIKRTHQSQELRPVLPNPSSELYRDAGLERLNRVRQRWESLKGLVPENAGFVDESLDLLAGQIQNFLGAGLVVSHNDICNANWIICPNGQIYLIDLDLMSMEDPACDLGATLWWYYPPELRRKFLKIAGYDDDEPFQIRMQARTALHCLAIRLPREGSFDELDPGSFSEALTDFKAVLAGEENPQGTQD